MCLVWGSKVMLAITLFSTAALNLTPMRRALRPSSVPSFSISHKTYTITNVSSRLYQAHGHADVALEVFQQDV